jgi:hypothetical protein
LFSSVSAAAQTVSGSVREEESGAAIAGARVTLQPLGGRGGTTVATDDRGAFLVPLGGRSARYVILVVHPSYLPLADTLELRSQETVTLELRLGRDAIPLQPLVVKGRVDRRLQGYRERLERGSGLGRFVTREQMDGMAAHRATDYLRRTSGVQLQQVSGGRIVALSGPPGICVPVVFIDGMPLEQRVPDEVDERLDPELVEGIEIYHGSAGLPMEFASAQPSDCGVVAFWTRALEGRPVTWAKVALTFAVTAAFIIGSWNILM